MPNSKELEERLIRFATLVLEAAKNLPEDRIGNHLGGQLIRSGTSPALNYGEARAAESRRDFVHKLAVVLKELRESYNTLRILSQMAYINMRDPAIVECNELISIFTASIKTLKETKSDQIRNH